jgi:hypothetical protein
MNGENQIANAHPLHRSSNRVAALTRQSKEARNIAPFWRAYSTVSAMWTSEQLRAVCMYVLPPVESSMRQQASRKPYSLNF